MCTNPGFETEVLQWIPAIFTMKSNARQREAPQNALRKRNKGSQKQDDELCKRLAFKAISPVWQILLMNHHRII